MTKVGLSADKSLSIVCITAELHIFMGGKKGEMGRVKGGSPLGGKGG